MDENIIVAPHAGAWIESIKLLLIHYAVLSGIWITSPRR